MKATTKFEAEKQARALVNKWTVGASVAGLIPGAGLALTAADYVLARNVAHLFDVVDNNVEATMAALAGALVGRAAAGLLSFIPGVNAVVAGATTKAIGEAVIDHYKTMSPLP